MDEFKRLLMIPHEFLFNRNHYFQGDGRPVLDEFIAEANGLTEIQSNELLGHLSFVLDPSVKGTRLQKLDTVLADSTINRSVRQILGFYRSYGRATTEIATPFSHKDLYIPDDEKIEDAGLYET